MAKVHDRRKGRFYTLCVLVLFRITASFVHSVQFLVSPLQSMQHVIMIYLLILTL